MFDCFLWTKSWYWIEELVGCLDIDLWWEHSTKSVFILNLKSYSTQCQRRVTFRWIFFSEQDFTSRLIFACVERRNFFEATSRYVYARCLRNLQPFSLVFGEKKFCTSRVKLRNKSKSQASPKYLATKTNVGSNATPCYYLFSHCQLLYLVCFILYCRLLMIWKQIELKHI